MGKRMNKTIICFGISILILCVVSMGIPVAESVETVLSHNHSLIDYSKYYVEYHNYISGETYRVNENNESQIRDKVEQDWTCDNAESGIVTSIARDRLSNIFDFHLVRSVASNTYLEYIHPGDVLLYQWKTGGYHVALVTQSSWLMGTNITQHTTDRENVSFNYAYILSYNDACETRLWQHAMSKFTWQGV